MGESVIYVLPYNHSSFAGGDVNMIDNDNETPLYVVETIEVAQWLVNHGADPQWKNADRLHVSSSPPKLRLFPHQIYVSSLRTSFVKTFPRSQIG